MAEKTNGRVSSGSGRADAELLAEFTRLKQTAERANADAERARGALGEVLGRLKQEFGCDSVEQGQRELARLDRLAVSQRAEFEEALEKFKTEHDK